MSRQFWFMRSGSDDSSVAFPPPFINRRQRPREMAEPDPWVRAPLDIGLPKKPC